MKQRTADRLKLLEQRQNRKAWPDGLGPFYALPDSERLRRVAHLYGEADTNGKP